MDMSRLKAVFFFLLAFSALILIVNKFVYGRSLSVNKKWDKNQEAIIENELRRIFTECCGYTLIGEKPVSVEYSDQLDLSNQENRSLFFEELERIFKGSKNFILKTFHYDSFYSEIVLINVPTIMDLAVNNKYFSRFLAKHYKNLENFYTSLSNPKIHIFETLKGDEIAIGIALGFGTKNSKFFQRYVDLGFYLKKYPFICLLPFEPKPLPQMLIPIHLCGNVPFKPFIPKQNPKFASFDAELKEMEEIRDRTSKDTEIPYLFQQPFFLAKKGDKANKLHRKYLRSRTRLSRLFSKKNLKM